MKNYKDKIINGTIAVDGNLYTQPSIIIMQEVFPLDKYDFDKILNGKSVFSESKNIFLGTCLALLINMFAKFIGHNIDKNIIFDQWEIYAFLISLVLFIIVAVIDYYCPSKSKTIINKIKQHFKI